METKAKFIRPNGASVQILTLKGDKRNPEPDETRINFPGGYVYVARCSDGKYWCHVGVNHVDHGSNVPGETLNGEFVDARIDCLGKHVTETDTGDFKNPNNYHVAIQVQPLSN